MGIYIPNMEMPTGNPEEPTAVWIYPDGSVKAFYNCGNSIANAQAIPVPPHGRLIDGDALKTMWDNEIARLLEKGVEYLDCNVDTLFSDFKHDVDKMPTIIPTEEGER